MVYFCDHGSDSVIVFTRVARGEGEGEEEETQSCCLGRDWGEKVKSPAGVAKARDFIILTRANIIAEADIASHPTHSTVYVKHLKEDIFEHH